MLNINQNFDLKAPVFNFDRDYFNSVEELNAYDTSNVPDHFVTNVAGMLYQFTDGKWLPMIGTKYLSEDGIKYVSLGCENAYVEVENSENPALQLDGDDNSAATLEPQSLNIQYGYNTVSIDANYDESTAGITVSGSGGASTFVKNNQIVCGDDSFDVTIYGDEGHVEINDAQGRSTNYSASGFSGQTKDNTTSYSLSIPSDDDTDSDVSLSLKHEDYSTKLSTGSGLTITSNEGFATNIDNQSFSVQVFDNPAVTLDSDKLLFYKNGNTTALKLSSSDGLVLGNDDKVKLSRPTNDEGGVISGIKSLTSFSNPSATKVWATDGSTINMPTKFSDLENDSVYITGHKGETDAKFKIHYKDGDVLRSRLEYKPRSANVCIPELALASYDVSGNSLSQIRIRPEDNKDDGQYLIQIQDARGNKLNCVSTLYPNGFSHQNLVDNIQVELDSNELSFCTGYDDTAQVQLKITKDGITKTNGKATEVFAADGSIVDLSTKANKSDLDAKANKSDVLLKKGDNDSYYIENDGGNPGYHSFSIGGNSANGTNSVAVGYDTKAIGSYSHTEGYYTEARGEASHAEGDSTYANGSRSHSEGQQTRAVGYCSHAEGYQTSADGFATHVQGVYNVNNENAIHSVGIGGSKTRKNAEYIYSKKRVTNYLTEESDPKNGYKYLIGVGGYDGISTDNTTYKSVQEVIADLTARIEQLETKVKALEDANTPA